MGTVRRLVVVLICLAGFAVPTAAASVEPSPAPDAVEAGPTPSTEATPTPTPTVPAPTPSPAVVEPSLAPAAPAPSPTPTPTPTPTSTPTPPTPPPTGPYCERDFPAATSGALALDVPTVQAGKQALGVLTGLAAWPERIIGGGSGETFLTCTPWTPEGEAETMVIQGQDAGLFLAGVPAGTAPGTYPISVLFYEGPQSMHAGGTVVRLSATITVSSGPVASTPGMACGLTAAPATFGRLVGDSTARVGGSLTLGLADVPADTLSYFNEYDLLWFLACFDGRAVVVRQNVSTAAVEVALPSGVGAGASTLRLVGLTRDGRVSWERVVTVTEVSPRTPARPTLPATGPAWIPPVVLALVLTAAGALAVRSARQDT